jgi:hypothetical protein
MTMAPASKVEASEQARMLTHSCCPPLRTSVPLARSTSNKSEIPCGGQHDCCFDRAPIENPALPSSFKSSGSKFQSIQPVLADVAAPAEHTPIAALKFADPHHAGTATLVLRI